ncbi:MAG TPA: hypothetical protein VES42_26000 [Pilimelia sp.]|nr:hypothetical protein [Pilimelia sp.]
MKNVTRMLGALAERLAPTVDARATCGSWLSSSGCPCRSGRRSLKVCYSCSDGSSGCGGCSTSNGTISC